MISKRIGNARKDFYDFEPFSKNKSLPFIYECDDGPGSVVVLVTKIDNSLNAEKYVHTIIQSENGSSVGYTLIYADLDTGLGRNFRNFTGEVVLSDS